MYKENNDHNYDKWNILTKDNRGLEHNLAMVERVSSRSHTMTHTQEFNFVMCGLFFGFFVFLRLNGKVCVYVCMHAHAYVGFFNMPMVF